MHGVNSTARFVLCNISIQFCCQEQRFATTLQKGARVSHSFENEIPGFAIFRNITTCHICALGFLFYKAKYIESITVMPLLK